MASLNIQTLSANDVEKIHHWSIVQAARDAMANKEPDATNAIALVARSLGRDIAEGAPEEAAIEWFYFNAHSAIHGWVLNPPKA